MEGEIYKKKKKMFIETFKNTEGRKIIMQELRTFCIEYTI